MVLKMNVLFEVLMQLKDFVFSICSISQLRVWQHLTRQLQNYYLELTTQSSSSNVYVKRLENSFLSILIEFHLMKE